MFYNLRLESENYYYGILKETNCFNNETLKIAISVHMSKHVIKVNCPQSAFLIYVLLITMLQSLHNTYII